MSRKYYVVLGISKGADLKKIKRAYRTVAKKYHPDITRTKESAERFIEIREAYETLSDEAKRKRYDKELEWNKDKTVNGGYWFERRLLECYGLYRPLFRGRGLKGGE